MKYTRQLRCTALLCAALLLTLSLCSCDPEGLLLSDESEKSIVITVQAVQEVREDNGILHVTYTDGMTLSIEWAQGALSVFSDAATEGTAPTEEKAYRMAWLGNETLDLLLLHPGALITGSGGLPTTLLPQQGSGTVISPQDPSIQTAPSAPQTLSIEVNRLSQKYPPLTSPEDAMYQSFSKDGSYYISCRNGVAAFYKQTVTELTVPSNFHGLTVEEIATGGFYSCHQLSSVTVADGYHTIGQSAFAHCTALKTLILPDSVTQLGKEFLAKCNLEVLVLGPALRSIHPLTFSDATIAQVFFHGTENEWNELALSNPNNSFFSHTDICFFREEAPTEEGSFWHYEDGVPTRW